MKKTLLSFALLLIGVGAWAQVTKINTEKYYTLECKSGAAHSTSRFIGYNDGKINGQSSSPAYFKFEAASDGNAYYIYCVDAEKYLYHDGSNISASTEKKTAWTLGVPTHTPNVVTFTIGSDKYLNNNGSDCTDNSCSSLKANTHKGGPAANNACSLWEMKEYDQVIKKISFSYAYKYNGEVVATEKVKVSEGEAYPTPNLPVGIVATIPEGNVKAADEGKSIEVACTLSNCPVEFATDAESITKWYYLKAHSNTNYTKYIQYVSNDYIEWTDVAFGADEVDSHLWGFVGNPFAVKVISKTAKAGVISTGAGDATIGVSATAFYMAKNKYSAAGVFCLKHSDKKYLNAQFDDDTKTAGRLKHWSENDEGSTFIPVGYVETEVDFKADYATLFLGYQTYVPENVEAYVVSSTTTAQAKLDQVEGIIPANTAVVLKAAAGNKYNFVNAIGTAATVETNLLAGTIETEKVAGPAYVLANVKGEVGFYQAKLDGEGKFQNNANKAYLPVTSEARFISFDFGTETAIEGVESVENNAVVYDLAGRRVQGAQKGIFIVNGKKVIK